MRKERKTQYYSVNNGRYYVKRTEEDLFYILTESGEWKYNPSLSDEFYDILSGYTEITGEAVGQVIREKKGYREGRARRGTFPVCGQTACKEESKVIK